MKRGGERTVAMRLESPQPRTRSSKSGRRPRECPGFSGALARVSVVRIRRETSRPSREGRTHLQNLAGEQGLDVLREKGNKDEGDHAGELRERRRRKASGQIPDEKTFPDDAGRRRRASPDSARHREVRTRTHRSEHGLLVAEALAGPSVEPEADNFADLGAVRCGNARHVSIVVKHCKRTRNTHKDQLARVPKPCTSRPGAARRTSC